MKVVSDVILYFILELCLIFINFGIFYSENGTFKTPLYIGCFLAFVVLIITLMALYESIKHRNDKESW
jgi:hypothetical protein